MKWVINIKLLLLVPLFLMTTFCGSRQLPVQPSSNNATNFSEDVNKIIIVSAPQELNTFKLGEAVWLSVLLKSSHSIIFNDHDVAIYTKGKNGFTVIENQNTNPNLAYIIEPNEVLALRTAEIYVIPKLVALSNSTIVRIVVTANIYDNKVPGKQVQAYIDVTLSP